LITTSIDYSTVQKRLAFELQCSLFVGCTEEECAGFVTEERE